MCKVLIVDPSGYYTWLHAPASQRAKDDEYLLGFIKQLWLESGCVYGYRKIHTDLLALGEQCGKHRVLRLMQSAQIQSERGYKRKAVNQRAKLSRLGVETASNSFHLRVSSSGVLSGGYLECITWILLSRFVDAIRFINKAFPRLRVSLGYQGPPSASI